MANARRLDDEVMDQDEEDDQALREDLALDVLEEEMDWKLDELHEDYLWRLVESEHKGDSARRRRRGHSDSGDEEEAAEESSSSEGEEEKVGGDSDDYAGPSDVDLNTVQFRRSRLARRKGGKRDISEHALRFKPLGYAGFKSQPFILSDEENKDMDESE
ncbi:hypothetical protein CPB86DRAFT_783879 [Serendipita vermifera]|nr:hypothetical protein CPB86DRAFT_783879 [Serendipita vermifera]